MDPMAVSLVMVEATLERICSGMMTRMIFLSFCDKKGLMNIHPEAIRVMMRMLSDPLRKAKM